MKYLVDPGAMHEVLVFHTELAASLAAACYCGRMYRASGRKLEEHNMGAWYEVDLLTGNAPIKIWDEAMKGVVKS